MTTTTVYSGGAQVDDAQATIERHTQSMTTGACMACGEAWPCRANVAAHTVFWRALRLPRRVPGLSRPELYGARVDQPGLLARAG